MSMKNKLLVHVAGTAMNGLQFCSRCGKKLWERGGTEVNPIPFEAKISVLAEGKTRLHMGPLDGSQYVVCVMVENLQSADKGTK